MLPAFPRLLGIGMPVMAVPVEDLDLLVASVAASPSCATLCWLDNRTEAAAEAVRRGRPLSR